MLETDSSCDMDTPSCGAVGTSRLSRTPRPSRSPSPSLWQRTFDGSSIVGPALEEFVIDNSTTMTGALTYPAATLDKSAASLTVRVLYEDLPMPIPATGWEY